LSSDLSFDYTNYKGDKSRRTVTPVAYRWGGSQWHPEPQWLMMALDHDKGEPREFAMKDMTNIVSHPFPVMKADATYQSPLRDLITRIDIVAQNHLAYSQACGAIGNLRDHLSAMAFCEEVNRREVVRSDRTEVARSEAAAPDAAAGDA
jgi:hypothetical protein